MPAKTLFVHQQVRKKLRSFPIHIRSRMIQSFDTIQQNPLVGTKLHGELFGYYKKRVGNYRIVYDFIVDESRVEIVKIEHLQGVYK